MKLSFPTCLPGEALKKLAARVPRNAMFAFCAASLSGFIVHFYMLVNKLPGRDEIPGLFVSRDRSTSGRFFVGLLRKIWTDYSMPFVNGIAAIVCIALCAALIVRILRIKKPLYAALTGMILISFPTVGNFLTYMYTVDAVMLGLLMGVFGAYLLDRSAGDKRGWRLLVPVSVLMALSMGTYQSNICFMAALLCLKGVLLLLDADVENRRVWTAFLQFVSALALAGLLYSLLSNSILAATGRELTTYQGLSEAKIPTPSEFIYRTGRAYRNFWKYLFVTVPRDTTSAMKLISGLTLLAGAVPAAIALLQRGLPPLRRVFAVLLLLLLPLCCTSIYLFGPALVHILMLYPIVFVYILPAALLGGEKESACPAPLTCARTLSGYATTLCLLISFYCFFVNANQGYLLLHLKYENCYSLMERVTASMEKSPDYVPGGDVVFIGAPADGNYPPDKTEYLDAFRTGIGFGNDDNYWYLDDDKHVKYFVKDYLGVNFDFVDEELLSRLETDARVKEMPCYPDRGAIAALDGVLVVKLGNVD